MEKILTDSTLIIVDPSTGNQKRVSFDRIKAFDDTQLMSYTNYLVTDEYKDYQRYLQDILTNYNTSYYKPDINLDFREQ